MISYFRNRCPSCEKAPVFTGIYAMSRECPSCGSVFEKESGYFIGAMIASYFLGVFLAFPPLLLMVFKFKVEMEWAIGVSALMIFVL
ncbi:MAG: DUF983 domain-containing protein, partial [Proteobacteria bacterium]|nr:DUF983 domain-containing protein [Pseudomonadota bacterium]